MKNLKFLTFIFACFLLILTACNRRTSSEPVSAEDIIQTMTITKHHQSDITDGIEYLSLEEAAIAGVEYILEFYEFNFEKTSMELQLIKNTESNLLGYNGQPAWRGIVSHLGEENSSNFIFLFGINAQNGDWLHIGALNHEPLQINGYSFNELLDKQMQQFEPIFPPIEQNEINEMLEVAKEYAQRHFRNSRVMNVEFNFEMLTGIRFEAEDEYGEKIFIMILRDNHILIGFDLFF